MLQQNRRLRVVGLLSLCLMGKAMWAQGTVVAWGANDHGQLGNGGGPYSISPVPVTGLTGVTAISAGALSTLALKSDGTVWAWGSNDYKQLGDGTTTERNIPVQVRGLTDVKAISTTSIGCAALKNDGTVWAWGVAFSTGYNVARQVMGLTNVAAIALGSGTIQALKNDGTLWSYGSNLLGEAGIGTIGNVNPPAQVNITGVTAISAESFHVLALKSDGTVWAWGQNSSGQLGDGTTTDRTTPVPVVGLTGVQSIATGLGVSMALKSDGTLWAWGSNTNVRLSDGAKINSSAPVRVTGLTGVTSASPGYGESLAAKGDGTVWAWGAYPGLTPVLVSGVTGAVGVAASPGSHSVALIGQAVATSLSANSGTPQSASISSTFAQALSAVVRDAANNPVPDINVMFTAPGFGPSGTFSNGAAAIIVPTNGQGYAEAQFTANSTFGGSYFVDASVGGLPSVYFYLTNTPPVLQSIAVTPANPSIAGAQTQQFTATGTYSDSSTQNVTASVTWASGTSATATISASGLASGVAAGTSTISATLGAISGSTTLTVTAPVLQSIAVTPVNPSIARTQTQQFTATGTYSDSSTQNLTASVTWASGTTATATISVSGLASGFAVGTSTISATLGPVSGSTVLTVTPPTLQSIAVTPANPSIVKGLSQQFTAIGTYSDSSTQNITGSVTWTSGTPATATISAAGLASGIAVGTSRINATFGPVSGSTTLTVTPQVLQSISVTPANPSILIGQTQQFTAIGIYSDSTTQSITASVTWASGTPATATISATGLAGAVATGTSTITATLGPISGSTILTVPAPIPVALTLSNLTQTYTGNPLAPTATTSPSGLAIIWTGTPQSAAGTYQVTATVNDPNYTGSATGMFVIARASSNTSVTGGGSFVYNRLPHAVAANVTGAGGLNQTVNVTYTGSCGSAPVSVAEGANCTAAASYAGDANHLPSSGSTLIAVTRAAASVSPGNGSKFYGTSDPVPVTTGTLSGFVAGDNVTSSYSRAAGETVGAYAIGATLNPSGVLGNYSIAYNTGTFAILRDTTTLTYTGPSASTYGQCSTVNLSAVLMDAIHGLPVAGASITFTLGTQTFTAVTNATGTGSVTATLTQNAGNTTVSASYVGSGTLAPSSSGPTPFNIAASSSVGPIPGAAIYTGPMLAWTSSSTSNNATATLSATIKDLAECSGGDIRTAKVTFAIRNGTSYTPIPGAQNLSVGLVSPADTTVGTASAIVNLNTANGSYSQFDIAVILGGNYTLNDPSTDTFITVAKPGQANTMIGDGKVNLKAAPASAGFLGTAIPAGAAGYLDLAAAVTYNKSLTNLQGNVQLLIKTNNKSDGTVDTITHTYLVKSTSIAGLTSPAPGVLTFTGKCVVQDVTNPSSPVSIDGGATLQVTTANAGTAQGGATGTVNIEVQPKAGGLWIAAGWNGTQPQAKPLVSGGIVGQ